MRRSLPGRSCTGGVPRANPEPPPGIAGGGGRPPKSGAAGGGMLPPAPNKVEVGATGAALLAPPAPKTNELPHCGTGAASGAAMAEGGAVVGEPKTAIAALVASAGAKAGGALMLAEGAGPTAGAAAKAGVAAGAWSLCVCILRRTSLSASRRIRVASASASLRISLASACARCLIRAHSASTRAYRSTAARSAWWRKCSASAKALEVIFIAACAPRQRSWSDTRLASSS
mmetsp:Transcript_11676/g.38472  ORF Transcript_11676/g.38472 Transcript_11676/m.38472 type:complete len:230 (-) Transcript_11676:268-957(-)